MNAIARYRALHGLALGLSLLAAGASAQDALDADAAVQRAFAQAELSLQTSALLGAAEADAIEARLWPNPQLLIEQERGRGRLAGEDETRLLLSQEFDASGHRRLQRDAAALGQESALQLVQLQRSALRAEVLRAFHTAAAASQHAEARGLALEELRELVGIAMRREQAGELSGFDRQRLEQQLGLAELQWQGAVAETGVARAALAGWIGALAPETRLVSAAPRPPNDPAEHSESPTIVLLEAQLAQAEAALRAERRLRLPIQLGLGQTRVESPGLRDRAVVFELEVPLPLFERNQGGVLRALAERDRIEAELQRARRSREAQVEALGAALRSSIDSSRQYRQQLLPQARALSDVARASFAEGELDLVGLLETLRAEAELEGLAIDETLRAQLARVDLDTLSTGDNP
jgi:cobalt-zinc-cadmium efflux system outer membrane protein